jgi:exonuclease SbcC
VKLTRLTVAGFGPYKVEQTVDFTRFDDDGIFLITGKTGAGKSSILDAVCFALYGSVPRYEGTQARLRSDHAGLSDPTFVELEFTVAGVDYRVRRTPEYERLRKNGAGVVKQAHEASLSHLVDGEWQGLAAKPVDVGHELSGVLLLTKEQFLQVILLAQNRFQEFLLAKNDDRQAVLRTLFGTKRFLELEEQLAAREKLMAVDLATGRAEIARLAARVAELSGTHVPVSASAMWFDDAVASTDQMADVALSAANDASAIFTKMDAAYTALRESETLQKRRDAAIAVLETLGVRADVITAERLVLDQARRAASVWPLAAAHDSALAVLATAESAEVVAAARYAGLGGELSSPHGAVSEISATLGSLADTIAQELRLPSVEADLTRLGEARIATETRLGELSAISLDLPEQLRVIDDEISIARVNAALLPALEEKLGRIEAAKAAAQAALSLGDTVNTARMADAAAVAAHASAASALSAAVSARLSGHAAELAGKLSAGEPCAVCGSITHPEPAVGKFKPVTEADVEAARTATDLSWNRAQQAQAALQSAILALAETLAQAGGKSIGELRDEAALAGAERENAAADTATVPVLVARRRDVEVQLAGVASTVEGLRDARETEIAEHARLQAVRDAIAEQSENNSAGFASVNLRVASLELQLAAAQSLIAAQGQASASAHNVLTALGLVQAQLVESAFTSVAEATAAHLPASEILAIEHRVRDHDQATANAESVLVETAGAPREPVDVAAAQASRAALSAQRDEALRHHSSAAQRAAQIGAEAVSAQALLAGLGDRAADYDQLRELASVVQGGEPNELRMRLESFVLAAQLEEIVTAANRRLKTMTAGRFSLEHDDTIQFRKVRSGLNLAIRDEHTGRSRAPHSLSGGETFLASLALALGLAEVVTNQTGGIRLDTLFVDEGFGSLDADTLEIAMTTLEGLRTGGRTIGLISHVEAMKEQIAAKLEISVTAQGHSVILPSSGTFDGPDRLQST